MKKRMIIFIVILCCICLLFSGCNFTILSANDLIRPPKLSGESSYLQRAFEREFNNEFIQMKTPISGENRSSFIIFDIDSDGNDDGLVLYSDPSSGEFAHIAVFNHNGNEWKLVSDVTGLADEIYEISFNDINGDGIFEILISWTSLDINSSYNETLVLGGNRTLTLYKFNSSGMTLLKTENFTKMLVKDFNGDGADDIFLSTVSISIDSNKTTGRIISFDIDYSVDFDESFSLISMIDVVSITSDTVNSGESDISRIYIDGVLSESVCVTDVISFSAKDKSISLPLHDNSDEIPVTARSSKVYSCDIDFDGIIEIPTLQELPFSKIVSDNDEEVGTLNLVIWSQLNDDVLKVDFKSLYNKNNNYYFIFDSEWISSITAVYNANSSLLVFYSVESGKISEQLFSVIACSTNDWNNNNKNTFELLYNSDSFVYGYKYRQNIYVTKQKIKDNFVVIS